MFTTHVDGDMSWRAYMCLYDRFIAYHFQHIQQLLTSFQDVEKEEKRDWFSLDDYCNRISAAQHTFSDLYDLILEAFICQNSLNCFTEQQS